jgi:hypothetical protein
MGAPITALAWEMWRKGRVSLAASCLLLLLASLSAVVLGPATSQNLYGWYVFLMVCSLFLSFAAAHYAERNPQKQWQGFPYRIFTLPVRTHTLVGVPLLIGLVIVLLIYFGWLALVFKPMGRPASAWPALAVSTGLLCYDALIWALAGYRLSRITALAFTGIILMNLGAAPWLHEVVPSPGQRIEQCSAATMMLMSLAAVATALYSVEKQRRGGGRGRNMLLLLLSRFVNVLPKREKDFRGPAHAQFWFEWRRAGWLLPVATAATLLFVFLPISLLIRGDAESAVLLFAWLVALPIILAFVIGKGFGKPDFWGSDLAVPGFLSTRPFTSGEFVIAKLKVATGSVLVSCGAIVLFLISWLSFWAARTELRQIWEAIVAMRGLNGACAILLLGLASALLLTWRGMVGTLWLALAGNSRRLIIAVSADVLILGTLVWWSFSTKAYSNNLELFVRGLGWTLTALVFVKLWGAVFSWRRNHPRRTVTYVAAWVGATAASVGFALLACPAIPWLRHLVLLAALLLVPLARLGLAPMMLARNRHQP